MQVEEDSKRIREEQNDQHSDFTASHLHHYYPSSTPLNFRVRMGSGALDVIWQIVNIDVDDVLI
jgi:hypothetical protein